MNLFVRTIVLQSVLKM